MDELRDKLFELLLPQLEGRMELWEIDELVEDILYEVKKNDV